jgi:hypothetical protein
VAAGRERILLLAVADHLDRSEMMLVELANVAPEGPDDVVRRQRQAEELLGANRLYRQAVAHAGEAGMASVLEDVERLLVEVAHQPSPPTPAAAELLRRRIESRGLLFKVRVLGVEVREKQKEMGPVPAGVS